MDFREQCHHLFTYDKESGDCHLQNGLFIWHDRRTPHVYIIKDLTSGVGSLKIMNGTSQRLDLAQFLQIFEL